MRAIAINEWGGPETLELLDVPVPPVAPDGVLVRIRAAGMNPVDHKIRSGGLRDSFPYHFPVTLGWDAAGVVEATGAAVTWFKPGDRVYGYCRRHELQIGTYAEYTTIPEGYLAHMPESLDFVQAAALPLAVLTAHQGLEMVGLREGEWLFVTGGAGGVGHFAIQLARARGARVIATGSQANHDFIGHLGATPLDYDDPELLAKIEDITIGGVDVAFDLFGGDTQDMAANALRLGGRLVSIASKSPPRDHLETHYEFVRPSGYDLGEHITPLVQSGHLKPEIAGTYPLADAKAAMARLEEGHVRGKLVLTID